MAKFAYGTFRMPYLPKPEYGLMIGLMKAWNMENPAELFAVALRVCYEVHGMSMYSDNDGKELIMHAIEAIRTMPDTARVYEVEQ